MTKSTKTGGTIEACPECDSGQIRQNRGGYQGPATDSEYVCEDCGARFDEPNERAKKATGNVNGLAKTLLETDP